MDDSDDVPGANIDDRPAAIAVIDRSIDLNDLSVHPDRADDAAIDDEPQVVAELVLEFLRRSRIPDDGNLHAFLNVRDIRERKRHLLRRIDAQQGDVALGVATQDGRRIRMLQSLSK